MNPMFLKAMNHHFQSKMTDKYTIAHNHFLLMNAVISSTYPS